MWLGVLFLLALAQPGTGNFPHEIIGTALGILFIIHNGLNLTWYKNLWRGPYTLYRGVWTSVNLLLMLAMAAMLVSGVLISRDLFSFLPFPGGWMMRRVHTCSAYWGFVLAGIHLGLHGNQISGWLARRLAGKWRMGLQILLWLAVLYGIKASFDWQIGAKLSMQQAFNNWSGQNLWSFLAAHVALLALYAMGSYYLGKGILRISSSKSKKSIL